MVRLILALLVIVWCDKAVASDCDKTVYDASRARLDAQQQYKHQGVAFIAVANGIGPARPALEHITLTKCIILDTPWQIIWVGADSSICPNHTKLEASALQYAREYNEHMLSLAQTSPDYSCPFVRVNPVDKIR
ncbi:hypothetical protein L1286_09955 [Pseudoalteromonas sp. SMS1]|uniref:hypothetical protein n=1 Tax=Pseudoalteromonas sp. SMS1 TaxID=2908894 RepID=UPI001F48C964|nr:hypothetical protein [Pseudoalteromonas sp. SMS1]MCF2857795.1 hypothetical protein [Pseudoalteromonas sp. SMS1]